MRYLWQAMLVLAAAGVLAAAPSSGALRKSGAHVCAPSRSRVSIAPYQGDKTAAVSLTFDDGSQNQAELAVPLLNEFHFHGTFYVVPGLTREKKSDPLLPGSFRDSVGGASWEEWLQAAAQGHEIGDHTLTHPTLTKLTDEARIRREIEGSAHLLTAKLHHSPLSLAYPHNRFNAHLREIALGCHTVDRVEPGIVYGYRGFTAAAANRAVDRAIRQRGWLLAIIHGIEQGYNPIDRKLLRAHLAYLKANESRLWIDTYANVSRYRIERERSTLEVTEAGPNHITFTLHSPLDDDHFDLPLTVLVHTGVEQAFSVRASRLGDAQPLPVRAVDGKLLVQVAPGATPVTVSWSSRPTPATARLAMHPRRVQAAHGPRANATSRQRVH